MPIGDDQDRAMDRLLRAAVPNALAEVSADCVDAEQLAAWADGGLDAAAAHVVESHLAACARCQAMAAAVARATPVAAVPARRPATLRWFLPVGAAAAAAVMIWITLPRHQPAAPAETMARNEAIASPAPVPTPPAAERPEPRPAAPASTPARRERPAPASVPAQPSTLMQTAEAKAAPMRAVPPSTPGVPPISAQSGERSFAVSSSSADNLPASRAGIAASAAREPDETLVEFAAAPPDARVLLAAPEAAAAPAAPAAAADRIARAVVARWRVLRDGRVERSLTGGASWEAIAIDPSLHVTGGAAVAPDICWLIGRAGVVLRAIDGVHFERVRVPVEVDLTAVHVTSDLGASVTAADGRVFVTGDGGATWKTSRQ